MPNHSQLSTLNSQLFVDIRQMIDDARGRAAVAVNAELTMLYWGIGRRLREHVLGEDRAEYGKQIIENLAERLTQIYGKGWSQQQLRHCLRTAETFPDEEILYTLCRELSWSHLRVLAYVGDPVKRQFYVEMARLEGWSVRQLNERIKSMLYERTAISRKPEETIQQDLRVLREEGRVSADLAFRDPYILDFLGLSDSYSERNLESAIIAELQRFITELGTDFAFVARQKRIAIDNRDYYIDLLFFHRRLRALVVIDLKIGEFDAGYKGQMELYLRYLEKHEMLAGERSPIGLILPALPQVVGNCPLQRRHPFSNRLVCIEVILFRPDRTYRNHFKRTRVVFYTGPHQLLAEGIAFGIRAGVQVLSNSLEWRRRMRRRTVTRATDVHMVGQRPLDLPHVQPKAAVQQVSVEFHVVRLQHRIRLKSRTSNSTADTAAGVLAWRAYWRRKTLQPPRSYPRKLKCASVF